MLNFLGFLILFFTLTLGLCRKICRKEPIFNGKNPSIKDNGIN